MNNKNNCQNGKTRRYLIVQVLQVNWAEEASTFNNTPKSSAIHWSWGNHRASIHMKHDNNVVDIITGKL